MNSRAGGPPGEPHYTATLDLRVHDPRERLPLLEMTLDALAVGEDLLVVTDRETSRLQSYIQDRYRGQVEWHPVQSGPTLWRTRLVRPGGDGAGG